MKSKTQFFREKVVNFACFLGFYEVYNYLGAVSISDQNPKQISIFSTYKIKKNVYVLELLYESKRAL